MTDSCPCGSGRPLPACCAPYLEGNAYPERAEDLMRARFSAYATGNAEFVVKTEIDGDLQAIKNWIERVQFRGLRVLDSSRGGPEDSEGTVTFEADLDGPEGAATHRETSTFERDTEGHWIFVKGRHNPLRTGPKVGRNDPCPCGSGKKYKKCCSA